MKDSNLRTVFYFCYYADFSAFAIFDDETEALRYAVSKHMECEEILCGNIKDQLL